VRAFWLVFVAAAAYQFLAIIAQLAYLCRRWAARTRQEPATAPGISVLKPLRGLDRNAYEAFVSQVKQHYSQFEIVFGASDPQDPAALEIGQLQREFPEAPIRLVTGGLRTANGKVGLLIELGRRARYPIWVVNDSDIKVTPEYLSAVTAPLADPAVGVVTCLYRARAHSIPAAWEALGIATDFMPSTLVAQAIGVREFGLGSTLAFRADDLERAGGFAALGDYLADDYQLAKRITALGKRAVLSTYAVETSVGDDTWSGVWHHQLRWARTIRLSKGGGYVGLPITQAGLWAGIAIACGAWQAALVLLALRVLAALMGAALVVRSGLAALICWLSPVWDLYSFAVWVASYTGRKVRWRDRVHEIDPEGRIKASDA
jgi:ceramide glucosyltransferase